MKKAFTLAEVLITLTIIGVVSALTLPALNNNTSSHRIGTSLQTFMNIFENGIKTYMNNEELTVLDKKIAQIEKFSKYLKMTPVLSTGTDWTTTKLWKLSNGMLVSFDILGSTTYNDDYDGEGSYKDIAYSIWVDIDGEKGQNLPGKDRFAFIIDKAGNLLPLGGRKCFKIYKSIQSFGGSSFQQGVNATTHNIKEADVEGNTCVPGGATSAYVCAGMIADNGWKTEGLSGY